MEKELEDTPDTSTGTPLVDWANPPDVESLKHDLTSAEPSHAEHTKTVEDYLDNLAGKLNIKIPKGRSKVQPKLIRTQAEWRYSALEEPFLSTKDMFDISPRTYEDVDAAEENTIYLNYQWNTKIDKTSFINEYVRTATDEGTVMVQVGWEFEEAEKEVEVDIVATPEQTQMYLIKQVQSGQMSEEEAMQFMQSGEPLVLGTKMETRTVTIKNQPKYRICEYDKCVIDPTCEGDLDKAQFIIMPFETSMSELKRDKSYNDTQLAILFGDKDSETVGASTSDEEFMSSQKEAHNFAFKDKARQKLTAYEYYGYWDTSGTGVTEPIKAVWVQNTMVKLEKLPYPDKKLPFVSAQYLPVRKSVYGEPDGALLADKQAVVGAVQRGMIDIMGRSANGQIGMSKGMLDQANQKKFDNGDHFFYNQGHDPKTSVHMQTFPEIPRSAMEMLQLQNQEAESLTGVKAYSSGISGQALGNTATAARGALDSASKRELGILRRLSKGIEQIGRKTIAMNAAWLEDEEVIRVTNKEFRTVHKDDLAGEFDLRLNISTAESDNQKAEELAFMLQTTAQSSDPGEVRMIRAEIAKLRKMPELAEQIENFQPEPDPMEQQRVQLELQLLQAKVFNEQAKGQENAVDVKLKEAKTASELAKAGKTSSEKDNLDLDFLEKESGTSHAREMEKKEHDRLSKLDEKAADSMFNPKPKGLSKN